LNRRIKEFLESFHEESPKRGPGPYRPSLAERPGRNCSGNGTIMGLSITTIAWNLPKSLCRRWRKKILHLRALLSSLLLLRCGLETTGLHTQGSGRDSDRVLSP
jgi:hypothetical protein